jgi:hypothetical protein
MPKPVPDRLRNLDICPPSGREHAWTEILIISGKNSLLSMLKNDRIPT